MSVETKGQSFRANDVSEFIASKYDYLGAMGRIEGDSLSPLGARHAQGARVAATGQPGDEEDAGPVLKLYYQAYPG